MKPIEPFGFFRAEPFGWTNCAETDDGAAPLYDQAAIDDLVKQRDKLLAALEGLNRDIQGLIDESTGVVGLHLNGDIATWGELESRGAFEWLTTLQAANDTIEKMKGGA